MGESRSVTIPARYLEGSYESYTGCTILQIALPPEMALPGYVVEVPRFLTAEAPDGGLAVFEGKKPFLCKRKDPPKGSRNKRFHWGVDEIAEAYAKDIAEVADARLGREKKRLSELRGPGVLVVAHYNTLIDPEGARYYARRTSAGLALLGGRWMYDLRTYDPGARSSAKGRHDRKSSGYVEIDSIPIPDVASAIVGKDAFEEAAFGMVECHRALERLEEKGLLRNPPSLSPSCLGEEFSEDVRVVSREVEEGFDALVQNAEQRLKESIEARLDTCRERALAGISLSCAGGEPNVFGGPEK